MSAKSLQTGHFENDSDASGTSLRKSCCSLRCPSFHSAVGGRGTGVQEQEGGGDENGNKAPPTISSFSSFYSVSFRPGQVFHV